MQLPMFVVLASRSEFWDLLLDTSNQWIVAWRIGGDFNIVRF